MLRFEFEDAWRLDHGFLNFGARSVCKMPVGLIR
jgi:hypothetical protein